MKSLLKVCTAVMALAVLAIMGATAAYAQQGRGGIAPERQFGVHITTGAGAGAGVAGGGGVQYAITPGVQIGASLNLVTGEGATAYTFSPWGKFLLEGTVNPFFSAGLNLQSYNTTDFLGNESTQSRTSLWGGFGLEYFINQNVGVYGMFDILQAYFSPSATYFGIMSPRVGIEWYFDK